MALLDRALALSRDGDAEGAAQLLRDERERGPLPDAHLSLLFQLVTKRGVTEEALELATAALDAAKTPLQRSTWALRRGLGHVERGDRDAALADLQLVLKLKANEGHTDQARAALLKVATLPQKK